MGIGGGIGISGGRANPGGGATIVDLPLLASAPAVLAGHTRLYAKNSGGNDGFTVLLAQFDSGDGSTVFVDESASPHVITAIAGADQTGFAGYLKFGPSVLRTQGGPVGAGDHLSIPDSVDFFFPVATDFTVDVWLRPNVGGALAAIWGQNIDIDNRIVCFRGTTGAITFFAVNATVVGPFLSTPAGAVPLDTWTHVAFERQGTTYRIYINGVVAAALVSAAVLLDFTSVFTIGQALLVPSFVGWQGFMEEFRVSKGISRYKGNAFPVPPTPYDTTVPFALDDSGTEYTIVGAGALI